MVVQLKDTEFIDSEPGGQIKPMDKPIMWQASIKINTLINMSNAEFVHKAGTQEYGFYLPATNQDAIKDKALNLGLNIQKADGSIDFTSAKEVQGL